MAGEKSRQPKIADAQAKIRADIQQAYAKLFILQGIEPDEAFALAGKRVNEGNIGRRTLEKVLVQTAATLKKLRMNNPRVSRDKGLGKRIAELQFGARVGRRRLK